MSQPIKDPILINAARLAIEHSDTFSRPSLSEIAGLRVGDLVKIASDRGPRPERFWCEVIGREGDVFTARIDNDLCFTDRHGLKFNDLIRFHADNIYALYVNGEPSHSGAIR